MWYFLIQISWQKSFRMEHWRTMRENCLSCWALLTSRYILSLTHTHIYTFCVFCLINAWQCLFPSFFPRFDHFNVAASQCFHPELLWFSSKLIIYYITPASELCVPLPPSPRHREVCLITLIKWLGSIYCLSGELEEMTAVKPERSFAKAAKEMLFLLLFSPDFHTIYFAWSFFFGVWFVFFIFHCCSDF